MHHCITTQRLLVPRGGSIKVGPVYSIVLNRGEPVSLKGTAQIRFFLGHKFRIVATDDPDRGPFKVSTVEYAYQFLTRGNQEFLTCHWTPEASSGRERTYPHLHVGSPMLAADAPIMPDRFNRLHVPTGRVSLEAVIRFAIEELGVRGKPGWDEILHRTQTAFESWRTRSF